MTTDYSNGFLHDDKGNLSLMRLMSLMLFPIASFCTIWQVVTNTIEITLLVVLWTLVFIPKLLQKYIENKINI